MQRHIFICRATLRRRYTTLEYYNSVNMRDRKTPDTSKYAQRSKDYIKNTFKQKHGIYTQQAHQT